MSDHAERLLDILTSIRGPRSGSLTRLCGRYEERAERRSFYDNSGSFSHEYFNTPEGTSFEDILDAARLAVEAEEEEARDAIAAWESEGHEPVAE
jgi:hypothetical protein